MAKSMATENDGMQGAHDVVCSTTRLRELPLRAKEAVLKSGLGVGSCIGFPRKNGLQR
jgi:hypothetical protein